MKSQSPVCHQEKQRSRHTNSTDVKTILTRRGIDTLGLLLLYEIDPELTRATHVRDSIKDDIYLKHILKTGIVWITDRQYGHYYSDTGLRSEDDA